MAKLLSIEGIDILQQQIERLEHVVGSEGMDPVLYEGAEIVTSQIQQNISAINDVTGRLSDSPVTKQLSNSDPVNPASSIAAIDRTIAPHAHLVEYGTTDRYYEGAYRGQMPAQPFFRPAIESTRSQVLQHIYSALKAKLEELGR